MTAITITVPGRPAPQGSKRHIGHGVMVESSREVGPWRERVAIAAHNAMQGQQLLDGPVHLLAQFVLPRPKSAPKTKPTPPADCQPDLDKLCRAVCDALQNTVVHNDSQFVSIVATKRRAEIYETFIGVTLRIRTESTDHTPAAEPTSSILAW